MARQLFPLFMLVALPVADGALRTLCAWLFAPKPAQMSGGRRPKTDDR